MIDSTSRNLTFIGSSVGLFCFSSLISLKKIDHQSFNCHSWWCRSYFSHDNPPNKTSRHWILSTRVWSCPTPHPTWFMFTVFPCSVTQPGLCPASSSCIFVLLKCHRDFSDSNTHSDGWKHEHMVFDELKMTTVIGCSVVLLKLNSWCWVSQTCSSQTGFSRHGGEQPLFMELSVLGGEALQNVM